MNLYHDDDLSPVIFLAPNPLCLHMEDEERHSGLQNTCEIHKMVYIKYIFDIVALSGKAIYVEIESLLK